MSLTTETVKQTLHARDDDAIRDMIKSDPAGARAGFVDLLQNLDAQLSQAKAESMERQSECLAMGPSGKKVWFDYATQHQEWRGRTVAFRRHVLKWLREAKLLLEEQGREVQTHQRAVSSGMSLLVECDVERIDLTITCEDGRITYDYFYYGEDESAGSGEANHLREVIKQILEAEEGG